MPNTVKCFKDNSGALRTRWVGRDKYEVERRLNQDGFSFTDRVEEGWQLVECLLLPTDEFEVEE